LLRLEVKLDSEHSSGKEVQQSLGKLQSDIIKYVTSDQYEEPPDELSTKRNKGLWRFSRDLLL
jgi:hypothetical protein